MVLLGVEKGAQRWGRLGAAELAGMRAFQRFRSGFWAGSSQ